MKNLIWNPNPYEYKGFKRKLVYIYDFICVLIIYVTGKEGDYVQILLGFAFIIIFLNIIPFQVYRLYLYFTKKYLLKKYKKKDYWKKKGTEIAKQGTEIAKMFEGLKQKDVFWLAPIIVLIIAIFPLPIGYYTLSRLVVCGSSIYFAYNFFNKKDITRTWIFGFFAVLYNPVVPVYLYEKIIWVIVNIITIVVFYSNKDKIK